MDNATFMGVIDSFSRLSEVGNGFLLWHQDAPGTVCRNTICQRAPCDIGHDDISDDSTIGQRLFPEIMNGKDMRMIECCRRSCLSFKTQYKLIILLLLHRQCLNGYLAV